MLFSSRAILGERTHPKTSRAVNSFVFRRDYNTFGHFHTKPLRVEYSGIACSFNELYFTAIRAIMD